jgi:anti-sigma factor RsiW
MNSHLSDEQLIGYSHATLTDAEREAMDSHLADCPDCRARLDEHEGLQRHIRHNLLADLRTARPPAGLTFSAIAPRLKRPKSLARLWPRSGQLVPNAMALTALAGSFVMILPTADDQRDPREGQGDQCPVPQG